MCSCYCVVIARTHPNIHGSNHGNDNNRIRCNTWLFRDRIPYVCVFVCWLGSVPCNSNLQVACGCFVSCRKSSHHTRSYCITFGISNVLLRSQKKRDNYNSKAPTPKKTNFKQIFRLKKPRFLVPFRCKIKSSVPMCSTSHSIVDMFFSCVVCVWYKRKKNSPAT